MGRAACPPTARRWSWLPAPPTLGRRMPSVLSRLRLSIPSKVFLGFAVVLMTFGGVTAFGVLQLRRVGEGLALVSQAYHPLTRLGAQLESSYRNSEQATARLLDEPDVRTRRALLYLALDYHPRAALEKVQAAQQVIARARTLPAGAQEESFLDRVEGLLEAVRLRYQAYAQQGEAVRGVLAKLEQAKGDERAALLASLDPAVRALKQTEQAIGTGLRDYSAEVDARINLRVRESSREERRGVVLVLVFATLAIGVGLGVTLLTQRLLSPIRTLTEAVKEVGEGRFEGELAIRSDDELGLLAREFNEMQKKLGERERQLQEKTQELLRSERLAVVGRLAAQITHEIRNPLSSISLNAELLADELEDDTPEGRAEARALLTSMGREVDRLAEITEDYLRFARLPKPRLAPLDLNDAVEELADFVRPEFVTAQVRLERQLDDNDPWVLADASQLRQVLVNLLRNARESAGAGGSVVLRTRVEAGRASVFVEDDGPGIPEPDRHRVLEPFFTTKDRGTGLGLALVQQIVHEHAGDLELDASPLGGALVKVTLPCSPPPLAASA